MNSCQPIYAWGERGDEAVDGSHRVHPADQQRKALPGRRVGAHEVRRRIETEYSGCLADALGRHVVSPVGRQMGRAMTDSPGDAFGQQARQGAVDRRVGLAQDVRQFPPRRRTASG